MNNAELIEGLKRHDADAAKYLHQCFTPSLWRFVYVRVDRDPHLAEDIVSESVLALIAAIERGIEIEFPGAWLRQVATRRIQDHFRAAARVRHLMETTSQSPDQQVQQSTPSDQEDAEQRREDVRAAMATLPERHQVALEWKYVDRCSVRDIAERLDVTVKAAESILFRARKQLKDQLQKIDSDAETLMRQWRFDDDDRYADQRQGFDRGLESDQDRGPDRHQGIMPFAITRDVMRLRS